MDGARKRRAPAREEPHEGMGEARRPFRKEDGSPKRAGFAGARKLRGKRIQLGFPGLAGHGAEPEPAIPAGEKDEQERHAQHGAEKKAKKQCQGGRDHRAKAQGLFEKPQRRGDERGPHSGKTAKANESVPKQ